MDALHEAGAGDGAIDLASLRRAWDGLRVAEPHLHNPTAAAMLRVPEAALIASRIGDGAHALAPDPQALLGPIAQWGRTLVAVANPVAVSLAFFESPQSYRDGDDWVLGCAQTCTRIRIAQVRRAFWFEDHDVHGNTRSLQLFDRDGDAVAKVFVFAKSKLDAVRAHLLPYALPATGGDDLPELRERAATGAMRGAPAHPPALAARAFVDAFELLASIGATARIEVATSAARQRSDVALHGIEHAGGGIHVAETALKLHMFPSRVLGVAGTSSAQAPSLLFEAGRGAYVALSSTVAGERWAALAAKPFDVRQEAAR